MPSQPWRKRQQAVADLNALAAADLRKMLGDITNTAQAQAALHDILPSLIDTYGLAAATLAADWYDELRDDLGVAGRFTAIAADVKDTGAHALVGWASATATDDTAFKTLLLGGMQRRIANFDRLTVMGSSIADPSARGWARVGDGDSCPFCDLLIGRGAVYTEASVDFECHDHCGCTAEPEFV